MTAPELKPCPFCGRIDKIILVFEDDYNYCKYFCDASGFQNNNNRGCGASSGYAPTAKEAQEKWNTRFTQSEHGWTDDRALASAIGGDDE